jgi:hypothetical protein
VQRVWLMGLVMGKENPDPNLNQDHTGSPDHQP